jgi:hypothetical protein
MHIHLCLSRAFSLANFGFASSYEVAACRVPGRCGLRQIQKYLPVYAQRCPQLVSASALRLHRMQLASINTTHGPAAPVSNSKPKELGHLGPFRAFKSALFFSGRGPKTGRFPGKSFKKVRSSAGRAKSANSGPSAAQLEQSHAAHPARPSSRMESTATVRSCQSANREPTA